MFTPELVEWLEYFKANSEHKDDFDIVFVSSDKDEASFKAYYKVRVSLPVCHLRVLTQRRPDDDGLIRAALCRALPQGRHFGQIRRPLHPHAGWVGRRSAGQARRRRPVIHRHTRARGQVIVDAQGNVLNADGRSVVAADPKGRRFPWRKE